MHPSFAPVRTPLPSCSLEQQFSLKNCTHPSFAPVRTPRFSSLGSPTRTSELSNPPTVVLTFTNARISSCLFMTASSFVSPGADTRPSKVPDVLLHDSKT